MFLYAYHEGRREVGAYGLSTLRLVYRVLKNGKNFVEYALTADVIPLFYIAEEITHLLSPPPLLV